LSSFNLFKKETELYFYDSVCFRSFSLSSE